MSTPEWLRPISERYLDGDPGRPPAGVLAAAGLSGLCTVISAGMLVIGVSSISRRLAVMSLVTLLMTCLIVATAAVLCAIFAASTVLITRRGWCRAPGRAGWVLGGVAAFGICVAAEPVRVMQATATESDEQAAAALPWMVVAALLGFGLALLLRTDSVSSWLAVRRHRTARRGPAGAP